MRLKEHIDASVSLVFVLDPNESIVKGVEAVFIQFHHKYFIWHLKETLSPGLVELFKKNKVSNSEFLKNMWFKFFFFFNFMRIIFIL